MFESAVNFEQDMSTPPFGGDRTFTVQSAVDTENLPEVMRSVLHYKCVYCRRTLSFRGRQPLSWMDSDGISRMER